MLLPAVISSRNYLYILANIRHMQISLTHDANADKLRSSSLTGGSLCLQGGSCYAQTWHLQSELINSYTQHFSTVFPRLILCCGACACDHAVQNQRICDIPVIMNSPMSSEPVSSDRESLLLCLYKGSDHSFSRADSVRKFAAL